MAVTLGRAIYPTHATKGRGERLLSHSHLGRWTSNRELLQMYFLLQVLKLRKVRFHKGSFRVISFFQLFQYTVS